MSDFETKNVKNLIRQLLKENAQTQQDLANYLQVSLPTVKRMLANEDIGLKRLSEIGRFFNLTISDLFELSRNKEVQYSSINHSQEKFFSQDFGAIKVFRALVLGLSLEEISSRYDLTPMKLRKVLSSLEKIKLIEVWPNDRIRLLVKWPFQFQPDGVFLKEVLPVFKKEVSKQVFLNEATEISELALRSDHLDSFKKEIKEILGRYKKHSQDDMRNCSTSNLKEVTFLSSFLETCIWDSLKTV